MLPGAMEETDRRLARMRQAPERLTSLVTASSEESLARRPAAAAWSITEIVCHLRDVEEFYLDRVQTILANRDPVLSAFDADRWAIERQYRRCACLPALEAFTSRRRETLSVLDLLSEEAWERGGSHPLRGWMTIRRIVHGWAKHDDEHADQVRRALDGRP
jgi:hypothetical protein